MGIESGYILYLDKNWIDLIWFKVSRIIGSENIRSRSMHLIAEIIVSIKKEYQILIDIFTRIVILVKNHFFKNRILIREYFWDQPCVLNFIM